MSYGYTEENDPWWVIPLSIIIMPFAFLAWIIIIGGGLILAIILTPIWAVHQMLTKGFK